MLWNVFNSVVVFTLLVHITNGDRTFTKVYEPILGTVACFKRLNGTHEIGCRSSGIGGVGVLHVVDDKQSLQWVLKDGPHNPYIAVMYPDFFSRDNIMQFKNSGRISGVLLLKENRAKPISFKSFSTDSSCPNRGLGIYNSTSTSFCPAWNEPGNNLLFENFDFPIFYVKNDNQSETILKCYETFNKPINQTAPEWPLCAAQLKSFMMAAVNSPTCRRRSQMFSLNPAASKVCDPLGDQNIVASLYSTNQTSDAPNNSVIVISARLDGASLFDRISPGADSPISALVTVLSIIKHLGSLKDQLSEVDSSIKNVYFMLFNGESFGYIGSSRIVYDMERGEFPLKLEQISSLIEINQVALQNSESYFIHQSDSSLSQLKEISDAVVDEAQKLNLTVKIVPKNDWGLPSSSLQSFLREKPDLAGIVITNHETSYRNKFYNSMFDDSANVEYTYGKKENLQQKISELAATVANSVIKLIDPAGTVKKVTADVGTVDEFLYCYLESANCTLFHDLYGVDQMPEPYPTYVGVGYVAPNMLPLMTRMILISYLENKVENITKDECSNQNQNKFGYFWMNGSCWESVLVNSTEAKSPAFIIENYNDWSSDRYSTWTESIRQEFSVRIFLKPSLLHEIMTLVSGIIVVLVSLVVVQKINSKADIIWLSSCKVCKRPKKLT